MAPTDRYGSCRDIALDLREVLDALGARLDVEDVAADLATEVDDDRVGWREELEENRRTLHAAGLWGVPSFRLLGGEGERDFCTWGADRIWLVEEEIRRRLGA